MRFIDYSHFSKRDALKKIQEFCKNSFHFPINLNNHIKLLIQQLRDDCTLVVEYPYVDKVYRDSFYTYYSSKLHEYQRDCIRVSIFKREIDESFFLNEDKYETLRDNYLGFFVIRPIPSFPLGRSLISAEAYKKSDFLHCKTDMSVTCGGLKFDAVGFPYASQNTETLSCAETTLWALMEYFSNKYSDYEPLLPSRIISILQSISVERQLPSKGLDVAKLSYALKTIGFGTKIYSRNQFKEELDHIISMYVESGIPIIATLENAQIGHAILCAGRDTINMKSLASEPMIDGFIDFDRIKKKYVFIDDNFPPYQLSFLEDPTSYYSDPRFQPCEIKNIIVPLYPKIYLEAREAKDYAINFFKGTGALDTDDKLMLRCFLMSSRSFKDFFVKSRTNTDIAKMIVRKCAMPKFVWIAELIDIQNVNEHKSEHFLLMDATELTRSGNGPLLISFVNNVLYTTANGKMQDYRLKRDPSPFELITHNLSGF